MYRLYWRYKKGGKWTWKPADVSGYQHEGYVQVLQFHEGEEE